MNLKWLSAGNSPLQSAAPPFTIGRIAELALNSEAGGRRLNGCLMRFLKICVAIGALSLTGMFAQVPPSVTPAPPPPGGTANALAAAATSGNSVAEG